MLSSLGLINHIKMIFVFCTEGFFGLLPVLNGETGLVLDVATSCGCFQKCVLCLRMLIRVTKGERKSPVAQINLGFAEMFNMLIVLFQEKDMVCRIFPTYLTKEFFCFYLSYPEFPFIFRQAYLGKIHAGSDIPLTVHSRKADDLEDGLGPPPLSHEGVVFKTFQTHKLCQTVSPTPDGCTIRLCA